MKRCIGLIALCALMGLQGAGFRVQGATSRPAVELAGIDQSRVRFAHVDVFVDSGAAPMAAWQLELKATAGDVKIVGIEGGEHSAFAQPPFYDPAAMMGGRVILAAYSLDEKLPAGKTRVARVHIRIAGETKPEYQARLVVAGATDGAPIPASVTVLEGDNP